MIRKVVILGGGSAGWMTAGLIAADHGEASGGPVEVTLVESPDVNTIGVGEGTWPTMRATLERIGIREADFLRACTAALKQGTRFVGWVDGSDDDVYYHPFSPPAGYPRFDIVPHWQQHRDEVSFAEAVTPQAKICDLDLAPKRVDGADYEAVLNYGYHLDAGRFAALLQRHCVEKLGVRHLQEHVTAVNSAENGDIESLSTRRAGDIAGDLFVDCSGQSALLIGGHFEIPFRDRSDVLFNDTAMAAQVPYANEMGPVASQTISTARAAGWIWDIGLASRRGVGYVYASGHCTDEEAISTLRQYLRASGAPNADRIEPRKIGFDSGHRQAFWHRNCVAVGMSAGFLEPLEASALVLVELSAAQISDRLPTNREAMAIVAKHFNETFLYRWDRIIEFLKLHYVLSRREEAYWLEHRSPESIPPRLGELLELWRHHYPLPRDFDRVEEVFSAASYQYVLYGMGFETSGATPRRGEASDRARSLFVENHDRVRELVRRLPRHRDLLMHVAGDEATPKAASA